MAKPQETTTTPPALSKVVGLMVNVSERGRRGHPEGSAELTVYSFARLLFTIQANNKEELLTILEETLSVCKKRVAQLDAKTPWVDGDDVPDLVENFDEDRTAFDRVKSYKFGKPAADAPVTVPY